MNKNDVFEAYIGRNLVTLECQESGIWFDPVISCDKEGFPSDIDIVCPCGCSEEPVLITVIDNTFDDFEG